MKPTNTAIGGGSQTGKTGIASHLHDAWPGGYVHGSSGAVPRCSIFVNPKRVDYIHGPRARTPTSVWKKIARGRDAETSQKRWWRHPQWIPPGDGYTDEDSQQLFELYQDAKSLAKEAGLKEGSPVWCQIVIDERNRWDDDTITKILADSMGMGIVVRVLCQHFKQMDTDERGNCPTKIVTNVEPEGATIPNYPWDEIQAWSRAVPYGFCSRRPRIGWRRHLPLPDPTR